MLFYNARWYDPAIGRFIQPDTIVPEPGNLQALNRYSYVLNNPLRFIDDSGKIAIDIAGGGGGGAGMAVVMLISGLAQMAGQQASALTGRLAPAANAMVQTWSLAGNQIIAAGDQLSQAAQNASQAGNTADPGGLDPNDPFRGLSQAAQRGIERLQRLSNSPIERFARGYQAQLNRAEYWARQGELIGVEQGGPGGVRYDLVLKGQDTVVEVKYWTARYALTRSNLNMLAHQLDTYQAQGKQVILEMFQTQTNALTYTDWLKISDWLRDQGIILSSQSQLLPPIQ